MKRPSARVHRSGVSPRAEAAAMHTAQKTDRARRSRMVTESADRQTGHDSPISSPRSTASNAAAAI